MEDITEEEALHEQMLIRNRDAAWSARNWDAFEYYEEQLEALREAREES